MNGLLLDKGAGPATFEQVIKEVAPTRLTDTYQPIQNKELLEMLEKVAGENGLVLQNPSFGLARKGQRMFGVYEAVGQDVLNGKAKLLIGVRNAFDGCLSAAICFGSKVIVCSNLCFSGYAGEEGISGFTSHKHSVNIFDTLYERMQASLSQVNRFRNFQSNFYRHLSKVPLTRAEGCEIIINAGLKEIIGKKDVLSYADEWIFQETGPRNESEVEREWHKEFKKRNAWSLMNAFTQLQKVRHERNPFTANQESIQLTRFLYETFPMN